LFPTDILGLEPAGFGGVLLSTPLHVFFFFFFLDLHHLLNVHVQLANKMGFNKKNNPSIVAWAHFLAMAVILLRFYEDVA
jgi:hypothetical protein